MELGQTLKTLLAQSTEQQKKGQMTHTESSGQFSKEYPNISIKDEVNDGEEGLSAPTVGPISIDPTDYLSPGALGKGLLGIIGGIKGFHGTSKALSKLSDDFVQDGVQGWGHYIAAKEGAAKNYAGDKGFVYNIDADVNKKQLLKLDKTIDDQSEEVYTILEKNKLLPTGYNRFLPVDVVVYSRLAEKLGSQKAASQYLDSIGIKGASYRHTDVSNSKDAGTAYLIYSDKNINIENPILHRGVEKGTMDLAGKSPRDGGIHLTEDEDVAIDFANLYKKQGKEGEVGSFKHNLKKPFIADEGESGVQWFPNVYVDALMMGESKLSKTVKAKLKALKEEWDTKFKELPDEGLAEAKDNLSGEINKKISAIVKEEGYDHVQYLNRTEGKEPKRSFIIFDYKDLERIK